jgi:hypothetical protein
MTCDLAADRGGIALNTGQVLWSWFIEKKVRPPGTDRREWLIDRIRRFLA